MKCVDDHFAQDKIASKLAFQHMTLALNFTLFCSKQQTTTNLYFTHN